MAIDTDRIARTVARPNGGVPDSLDEAKAAFRAARERPLSSGSGREMLNLSISVDDPVRS
jgi:hypothetical protein